MVKGFENEVLLVKNFNFNPSTPPNAGNFTTNGQLAIGSTAAPNIRVGVLKSSDGSINIAYDAPDINLTTAAAPSPPGPNAVVNLSEDFIGCLSDTTDGFSSQLSWILPRTNAIFQGYSTADHPGVVTNSTLTDGAPSLFAFYLATFDPPAVSSDNLHQGGGEMSCNWVINVATLSDNTNSYVLRLGLAFKDSDDPDEKSEFSDGFYFTYTHSVNSGNWTINTADAGVRTSTNSGQAVATGWVNLGVVINAAGTSAEYFIDDVSVGTITTNFPTHGFSPAFQMAQTGGEIPEGSVQPDLMYLTYTLTNPR